MKIINTIKNAFKALLMVIFFAFAIAMTILVLNYNKYGVAQFDDTTLVIIRGEVSNPKYKKGDLVLVENRKIDKVAVGDEVFVYKVDQQTKKANIELGNIEAVHPTQDAISFKNGADYTMEFVIGESTKVYNNIGTLLSIVGSKWGFFFIILVPCFLLFIYQIYALIVEIKYGGVEQEVLS